jgi:hypothetical protein
VMAPHQALRYRERTTVERVYSRLKQHFGAESVRVRGWAKVMTHLMFGILALTAEQILRLSPPGWRANPVLINPTIASRGLDKCARPRSETTILRPNRRAAGSTAVGQPQTKLPLPFSGLFLQVPLKSRPTTHQRPVVGIDSNARFPIG